MSMVLKNSSTTLRHKSVVKMGMPSILPKISYRGIRGDDYRDSQNTAIPIKPVK